MCPEGLDISFYLDYLRANKNEFQVMELDKKWFLSTNTYSALMLQPWLYERICSKYVLIYQLDAWVFRDELEYFCSLGYDYYGAPWSNGTDVSHAGNGGFSLRNANQSEMLVRKLLSFEGAMSDKYYPVKLEDFQNSLKKNKYENCPAEDIFFSRFSPRLSPFKVAPAEVSFRFAFEMQPEKMFERNERKLPFGCHAWEKYGNDFWKQFIILV